MYLSDRDLAWAIHCGLLIVEPKPDKTARARKREPDGSCT
jgi:hypothetical protein